MSSLNQVMLIGNLGRDPEVRQFQSGGKVANLRIATSESWKDKQSGERQEKTEWHTVAVFGPLADVAEKYLKKGSKVFVQGTLRTRKWQDQQGQDRYTTEVQVQGFNAILTMLDGKNGAGGGRSPDADDDRDNDPVPARRRAAQQENAWDKARGGGRSAMDDDIPFGPA